MQRAASRQALLPGFQNSTAFHFLVKGIPLSTGTQEFRLTKEEGAATLKLTPSRPILRVEACNQQLLYNGAPGAE